MKNTKKFAATAMAAALVLPGTAAFASGGGDDMKHEESAKNVTVKTKAADLRATLDQLLSEHFVLAVMDMKKQYDGSKDAQYYEAALKQNALDMTPAIASVYGDEGAKQFEKIFVDHNKYTTDLVKAVKADDQDGINASKAETEEFVQDLSSFLDTATEGKLPKAAAEVARQRRREVAPDPGRVAESRQQDDGRLLADAGGVAPHVAVALGDVQVLPVLVALVDLAVGVLEHRRADGVLDDLVGQVAAPAAHELAAHRAIGRFTVAAATMRRRHEEVAAGRWQHGHRAGPGATTGQCRADVVRQPLDQESVVLVKLYDVCAHELLSLSVRHYGFGLVFSFYSPDKNVAARTRMAVFQSPSAPKP